MKAIPKSRDERLLEWATLFLDRLTQIKELEHSACCPPNEFSHEEMLFACLKVSTAESDGNLGLSELKFQLHNAVLFIQSIAGGDHE